MALFSECMQKCGSKVIDTADIVREGFYVSQPEANGLAIGDNHAGSETCGINSAMATLQGK